MSPYVNVTDLRAARAPRRPGCGVHCRQATLFVAGRRRVQHNVALHDPDAHEAFGRITATMPKPPRTGLVRSGLLAVDLASWRIIVDGSEPHLTPIAHRLLVYLAARAGVACPAGELIAAVWGVDYLATERRVWLHLLRTNMSRLRRAIWPADAAIVTIPGKGYRLDADPAPSTNGAYDDD